MTNTTPEGLAEQLQVFVTNARALQLRLQGRSRTETIFPPDSITPELLRRCQELFEDNLEFLSDAAAALRTSEEQRDRMGEALEEIAGGWTPGLSDLILAGDWHSAFTKLQVRARQALAQHQEKQGSARAQPSPTQESADTEGEWVLVPREPTEELVRKCYAAGMKAVPGSTGRPCDQHDLRFMRAYHAALLTLSAIPALPVKERADRT